MSLTPGIVKYTVTLRKSALKMHFVNRHSHIHDRVSEQTLEAFKKGNVFVKRVSSIAIDQGHEQLNTMLKEGNVCA